MRGAEPATMTGSEGDDSRDRQPRDRSERMVLNNYPRPCSSFRPIPRHLSPDFIFELHRIVTEGTLDRPRTWLAVSARPTMSRS